MKGCGGTKQTALAGAKTTYRARSSVICSTSVCVCVYDSPPWNRVSLLMFLSIKHDVSPCGLSGVMSATQEIMLLQYREWPLSSICSRAIEAFHYTAPVPFFCVIKMSCTSTHTVTFLLRANYHVLWCYILVLKMPTITTITRCAFILLFRLWAAMLSTQCDIISRSKFWLK